MAIELQFDIEELGIEHDDPEFKTRALLFEKFEILKEIT